MTSRCIVRGLQRPQLQSDAEANCTLLTGALTDVAVTGAVSCRMPCESGPRASVLPPMAPAPDSLRAKLGAICARGG